MQLARIGVSLITPLPETPLPEELLYMCFKDVRLILGGQYAYSFTATAKLHQATAKLPKATAKLHQATAKLHQVFITSRLLPTLCYSKYFTIWYIEHFTVQPFHN